MGDYHPLREPENAALNRIQNLPQVLRWNRRAIEARGRPPLLDSLAQRLFYLCHRLLSFLINKMPIRALGNRFCVCMPKRFLR